MSRMSSNVSSLIAQRVLRDRPADGINGKQIDRRRLHPARTPGPGTMNSLATATGVRATVSGAAMQPDRTRSRSNRFVRIDRLPHDSTRGARDVSRAVRLNSSGVDGRPADPRSALSNPAFGRGFRSSGGRIINCQISEVGAGFASRGDASVDGASVNTGSLAHHVSALLLTPASGGFTVHESDCRPAAQMVAEQASTPPRRQRGQLAALQNLTAEVGPNDLGVACENASAAKNAVCDTAFVEEAARLTRAQILAASLSRMLAFANPGPPATSPLLKK
jgi:flagellin-like hook-associated protein FlgL